MATTLQSSKLFWLGFAIVGYAIARSLSWHVQEAIYLYRVNALSTTDDVDGHNQQRDRSTSKPNPEDNKSGTEDDLSIKTLEILSHHPNYDIREAARKVALDRFAHSKECCARLRRDLRDSGRQADATAVLRALVAKVDMSTLLGPDFIDDAEGLSEFADEFLAEDADSHGRSAGVEDNLFDHLLDRQGPMVTLEEVEGENGAIVSVRVPSVRGAFDAEAGGNGDGPDELELRRWQRREAMVVQLDALEDEFDETENNTSAEDVDDL